MKINTLFQQNEKIRTKGAVIVVDILRAATVEAFLLAQGATRILPVETVDEAFMLKKNYPDYLLVGEENGYPIKGFDFGNSPSQIHKRDFSGKTIVHRSSNGTRQLLLVDANSILLGSLITISNTYRYLSKQNISTTSLIGAEEDDKIFFKAWEQLANEKRLNKQKIRQELIKSAMNSYFFNDAIPEFPKKDVFLSASVDRFDFACVVTKENGRLVTKKVIA